MTALEREMLRSKDVPQIVIDRMGEVIKTFDDNYGAERSCFDYGGYVLYFPNEQTYQENISDIFSFYHINMEDFEYSDTIGKGEGKEWHETLYLLSSDDGLVLIYPQEVGDGRAENVL